MARPAGSDQAGRGAERRGRPAASGRQGAASLAPVAYASGLLAFRETRDLGRRVASAGHGGVEPGRGSASAPPDPWGEHRQGQVLAPGRELRGGRGVGAGAPRLFSRSFILSLVDSFVQWSRQPAFGEVSGPGARGDPQSRVEAGRGEHPDTPTPRHPDTPVQRHGKSSADLSSRGYHGAGAG